MSINIEQIKFIIAMMVGAFTFGIYISTIEYKLSSIEKSVIELKAELKSIDRKMYDIHINKNNKKAYNSRK